MGQYQSVPSSSTVPTINYSTAATTNIGAFALTNGQGKSSLVVRESITNTYFTLPADYSFQIQNGGLSKSGAFYLALRAFTNFNFRSFEISAVVIAEVFGLVPTVCTYKGQLCSISTSNNYKLTLYITSTVNANDPVTLLDSLAVREFVFEGDSNTITVDFKYVVYNKSTSCFVVADASVTIICNYSPNGLVNTITDTDSTVVTFDFVFNGNLTTDSYLSTIRPYVGQTTLTEETVTQFNKNALYNLGNDYMGSLTIVWSQANPPILCAVESDINSAQVGAVNYNN
jgi:hypothetical protein